MAAAKRSSSVDCFFEWGKVNAGVENFANRVLLIIVRMVI
jgi:hypothetical protein